MEIKAVSRRDFLRNTGLMAIASATGGAVILGHDYAWALSTSSLDPHTAETLMAMARQPFHTTASVTSTMPQWSKP